jgi:hypothetical protein
MSLLSYLPWSSPREAMARMRLLRQVAMHTKISREKLSRLCDLARQIDRDHVHGAIVECGVYKGGGAAVMASCATPDRDERFWDDVARGGFVVFDDYGRWKGCTRAVDEFMAAHRLSGPLERTAPSHRALSAERRDASPRLADGSSVPVKNLRALSMPELTRAIRALSARYVESRAQLPDRSPLDSAGKRAAFATLSTGHCIFPDRSR